MSYGLQYFGEFNSVANRPYRVEILQKDYVGPYSSVKLAASPVIHSYQTDDIRSPIRGSSASVNIINEGNIPITTFFSISDDQFKIIIYQGATILYIGYVVQDDSNELMVDFAHEITLQTNDNLGLLKDIPFDTNPTVITDFQSKQSIAAIFHQCLKNTGLDLETYVYANIWENSMTEVDSFLPQTLIDLDSYISGQNTTSVGGLVTKANVYQDCYTIMSDICDKFNLSLFQALGRWNIVRWDELFRLTTINAFIYNSSWALTGTALLPDAFTASAVVAGAVTPDTYPVNGLTRQIVRPFKFVKETFNYRQPKYLLRNYDLQTLGALIRQYVGAGGVTIYEYVATDWEQTFVGAVPERFIRVVRDSFGNELSRELVVRGVTGDSARSVQSLPIEVTAGGKIKFSFSYRTNISVAGPSTTIFAVRLFNGTTNRYVDEVPTGNGNWIPGIGFNYSIASGDNSASLHSVEIDSSQIPFDGLLYCYLAEAAGAGGSTGKETIYSDIRFEYTPFINDQAKIIGHVHYDLQDIIQVQNLKNNEDAEIKVDDSPTNDISGTLFLNSVHNLIQDRTKVWHRAGYTEALKLGHITTMETLQWRMVPRTKLQGSFRGLYQNSQHLSLLNILKFDYLNPARFVFGQIDFDFRNDEVNCTAWQLNNQDAADPLVSDAYSFTYIYSTT